MAALRQHTDELEKWLITMVKVVPPVIFLYGNTYSNQQFYYQQLNHIFRAKSELMVLVRCQLRNSKYPLNSNIVKTCK